jgi:GDPmannose 4,6-dehydratase
MTNALITGVTGQDGSYLAEYLLSKGYDVYGLIRRASSRNRWRIANVLDEQNFKLIEGDMCDYSSLLRAVRTAEPDEVYNLAAQSFVGTSFKQPLYTGDVTGLGVVRLLDAVRKEAPEARFYQASTSELFGNVTESPQNESTDFHPRSPYGVAKLYGHWATVNYRESYDMYAVSGILFNHESPRRGEEFVTRKITLGAARIKSGLQDELRLGNLDASRDWGDARDYVVAMHQMLQQDTDDLSDYVIGTGRTNTVRECARIAFETVGLNYKEYVEVDERFYRPAEVDILLADASKAKSELGWEPTRSFEQLVQDMVQTDYERIQRDDIRWMDQDAGLLPQSTRPEDEL